ncbi:MAG: Gx transporter family protein, partial [Lachnospiraceae bacterium]|nr:Gx transporter family protein [Lachnospiraceae bacterium]
MKTRQVTELGLLLALSLVLAYLESLLPVMVAVPGVKLGLANIITMLVLYLRGGKPAFFFMVLRVAMAGFLFSGISGIIYS